MRAPVAPFTRSSARVRPRLGMKGKGWAGSTASGVSTGKTWRKKCSSSQLFSALLSSDGSTKTIFSPLSSSCRRRQRCICSSASSPTRSRIRCNCSTGERPSSEGVSTPVRNCPQRPATRTMKNSSRLLAEMETKRTRSSSGCDSFDASSSTRRLNSSQESSRLMNRFGDPRSASPVSSSGRTVLAVHGQSLAFLGQVLFCLDFPPFLVLAPVLRSSCDRFHRDERSLAGIQSSGSSKSICAAWPGKDLSRLAASGLVMARPRASPSRSSAATIACAASKERSIRKAR